MFSIRLAPNRIPEVSPASRLGHPWSPRLLIASLVSLTIISAGEAHARQVSLLLLGGFHQSVSLGYGYSGASSDSSGSTTNTSQNSFDENYTMGLRYAIYTPRLLQGNFSGNVSLNQNSASGSSIVNAQGNSNRENFQYRLTGTLLERLNCPVTFYSYSQLNRVQLAFSPSYDLRTDGLGAAITVGNRYLPVSLSYTRSTSNSTGQGVDVDTSSESLSFSASHSYRNLSQSGANINFAKSDSNSSLLGLATSENSLSYGLSNDLIFDRDELRRVLRSRYLFLQETGTRQFRSGELDEELSWQAGKALSLGLNYNNRYEHNDFQDADTNSGKAWLEHRLFQSLLSRIEGHARQTDLATGKIRDEGGFIHFDYSKELPQQSRLQAAYTFDYEVSDTQLGDNVLFATNEPQTVPDLPPFELQLKNPDVIRNVPGDIVVQNSRRTFTYHEGTDYTVERRGELTYIIFPNLPTAGPFPIDKKTVLSIDYRYQANPSTKYASTTNSAWVTLSLYANRHRIYARFVDSEQKPLSGQTNTFRLNSTRLYTLGFDTNLEFSGYGASYRRYESAFANSDDFDAYARYARYFQDHYLSLNLRERYSINQPAGLSSGYSTNSFSAAGTYQRVLAGWLNMKATGLFTDVHGTTAATVDSILLGLDLDTRFGKSALYLSSTVGWQFWSGNSQREESIRLTFTRYF